MTNVIANNLGNSHTWNQVMAIQKQAGKTLSDRALERVMRDVLEGVWHRSLHDLYPQDASEPKCGEAPYSAEDLSQKPK